MQKNQNLSRIVSRFAIAAVLGLAAVGLTQCRLMNDSVTGVDLGADQSFHGRASCIDRCRDNFKDAMDKESCRHEAAMKACDKKKKREDRDSCKKAERALHEKNKKKLNDEMKACKAKCYNEGGGGGGR